MKGKVITLKPADYDKIKSMPKAYQQYYLMLCHAKAMRKAA